MNKLIYAVIFCFVLLIPLVSAAPPVLSTVQSGSLEIITPTYNYVTQNADKDIYWHLFNTTNLLTNNSATCYYHLYSQNLKGEHIVTINGVKTFTNGRDFEVEVKGGNFSTNGEYCHLIECNTSTQTGGIVRCFTVTPTGFVQTTAQSLGSLIFFISIMFLTILFGYIGFRLFQSDSLWVLGVFFIFMALLLVIYNSYLGIEFYKFNSGSTTSSAIPETIFMILLISIVAGLITALLLLMANFKKIVKFVKHALREEKISKDESIGE